MTSSNGCGSGCGGRSSATARRRRPRPHPPSIRPTDTKRRYRPRLTSCASGAAIVRPAASSARHRQQHHRREPGRADRGGAGRRPRRRPRQTRSSSPGRGATPLVGPSSPGYRNHGRLDRSEGEEPVVSRTGRSPRCPSRGEMTMAEPPIDPALRQTYQALLAARAGVDDVPDIRVETIAALAQGTYREPDRLLLLDRILAHPVTTRELHFFRELAASAPAQPIVRRLPAQWLALAATVVLAVGALLWRVLGDAHHRLERHRQEDGDRDPGEHVAHRRDDLHGRGGHEDERDHADDRPRGHVDDDPAMDHPPAFDAGRRIPPGGFSLRRPGGRRSRAGSRHLRRAASRSRSRRRWRRVRGDGGAWRRPSPRAAFRVHTRRRSA